MSLDSLSDDLFEVLWHDEALNKSSLIHFSKKFPFWAIQAHLAENYATNCSRDFQKHSSMMWCSSQTLVIFVTFPKIPFLDQWQFRQKWCYPILMIYSVTIFLKGQSMMRYNSWTKAMLVNFSKKFPFGEITRTEFGLKLCTLLSYYLLFADFFKCCSMKEFSRYTIVTVNFAKISLLEKMGNLDPIWAKIMEPYICLERCMMLESTMQTKAMVVNFSRKIPFCRK